MKDFYAIGGKCQTMNLTQPTNVLGQFGITSYRRQNNNYQNDNTCIENNSDNHRSAFSGRTEKNNKRKTTQKLCLCLQFSMLVYGL